MRRKHLDFILFVLIFIYDRMTCEVTMGTHHLLQQFTSQDQLTATPRRNSVHHNSLSSNLIIKANFTTHYRNSSIAPNDAASAKNASGNDEKFVNKFNGASNSSIRTNSQFDGNNAQHKTSLRSTSALKKRRSRRDVLLLYNVVACGTGCNPMRLMGYGCYCGFMGAGIPVDGIDRCCQVHDWCYENVPCPSFMLYFLRYKWQCVNGTPECYAQTNNCAYQMCQCDRMFAECLKQQPCPNKKVFCRTAPWRLIQNLIFDVGIAG